MKNIALLVWYGFVVSLTIALIAPTNGFAASAAWDGSENTVSGLIVRSG